MADQNSRQDENKFAALIAHTGTAGTSETIRLVADANGNLTVSGTVVAGGSNVNVVTGTQQTLGTVGVLNAGSVVVTVGTTNVTTGSIVQTAGTVTTGSLTNLATLGTIQNVNAGTITPNLVIDRTALGTLLAL